MTKEKAPLERWELNLLNQLYQTGHEIRYVQGEHSMAWEVGIFVKPLGDWVEGCGGTIGAAVRSLRKQIADELSDLMEDHEIVVKVVKKGKGRK